jgi:L-aminopeptidase/D-esterase-like protein
MGADRAVGQPGPRNSLTDVPGIRVGHHTAVGGGYLTGTTVVLAPDGGMVAGVDVRGGGPATHETDLLHPTASVERIHALVLTGGSAYGLVACTGVMNALADRGIGLQVGPEPGEVVPLVPGVALFDLGRGGNFRARPTAEFGALALAAAFESTDAGETSDSDVETTDGAHTPNDCLGSVGAGTGAVTSNLKGGLGTASVVLPGGVTVAALAVVNAAGSPIDPWTGELLGGRLLLPADGPTPGVPGEAGRAALLAATAPRPPKMSFSAADPADGASDPAGFAPDSGADSGIDAAVIANTTLVVVATDATLTKAQCAKMAAVAQNGMARALNPVHTMFDGDVIFGVSTAAAAVPDLLGFHQITVAGADVVTRAIVRALLGAQGTRTPAGQWPSWSEVAFAP